MTVHLIERWTCGGCRGVEEVDVHVAPTYVPPPGWSHRDGVDLCIDCLVERNRARTRPGVSGV